MRAPRDILGARLARARRHLVRRQLLRAAATGFAAAAVLLLAGCVLGVGSADRTLAAAAFAAVLAGREWRGSRAGRSRRAAAHAIERHDGSLKNLVVTAEELLDRESAVRPYMRARVLLGAAQAIDGIDMGRVVTLGPEMARLLVAALALVAAAMYAGARVPAAAADVAPRMPGLDESALEVDIVPPAYTRRPAQHLRDPRAIQALAGSALAIRVRGLSRPEVRVNGISVQAGADGIARAAPVESGAITVDAGRVRALVPLTVIPDAAPDVRVTAPGRDLRVAGAAASIAVHATATDDVGLRALELRYTVVSGGGEEFTFREGTLPVALSRRSDRAWDADAVLPLSSLKLEAGDALVYRALAVDGRPGSAGEASSDTYFVEIAGPGDVPLDGADMPPDRERYALSEAMIVMKIQRLIAQQSALPRAGLEEAAGTIAAEQRAVRANFIFMLGGEVEDEVVEAEASHEIQEGRLANQARREIVAATVLMGRVEQALAAVVPGAALPPAQEAVRTLQRAFGHSRYLLRALPARIRIDPSRRLSGDVAAVHDWRRDLVPVAEDPRTAAARAVLADLIDMARLESAGGPVLARLAERMLAVEPGAADLQQGAQRLLDASHALSRGETANARTAIADAAPPLVRRAARAAIAAGAPDADALRLAGAAAIAKGGGQ